jgi:uncharacterized membrane protein
MGTGIEQRPAKVSVDKPRTFDFVEILLIRQGHKKLRIMLAQRMSTCARIGTRCAWKEAMMTGPKKDTAADITRRNVELIAEMEKASDVRRTWGERIADFVAAWVGSWPFLIVQSVVLAIWIALNLMAWRYRWDPYPFILLNLVLSFQAAYATPIILMSQNRQGKLADRRNKLDLQINLLAEQENTEQLRLLRLLCEKAGIAVDRRLEKALEEATEPSKIVRQIDEAVDGMDRARDSR